MIRRVAGKIGAHNINIKPFIFTDRYVRVLKKKKNITEIHGSPKSISNQAEEAYSGNKILADSFGKKSISNFFGDSPVETIRENLTENSTVPKNN